MPHAEFKVIPAYPKYEVSTEGQIRNRTKGNTLKYIDNGKGYQSVKLYSSSRPQGRRCLVHRIVLSTFCPIEEQMDVNHKDGNKNNNRLSNLEWITKSDNTRHAHVTGLFKSRSKLSIEQVREIKARIAIVDKETYTRISKDYNVKPSIISKIAHGQLYSYV